MIKILINIKVMIGCSWEMLLLLLMLWKSAELTLLAMLWETMSVKLLE